MATDAFGEPTNDPVYEMDGSGVGQGDLGSGGEQVNKDGTYHLECTDVKEELDTLNNQGKPKSPCIVFHLQVQESVKGQSPAGSRHFHRIYVAGSGGGPLSDGARNSAFRFGLGLGLLEEIEIDGRPNIKVKGANNTRIPLSVWHKAKGMQLVAKIEQETKEAEDEQGNKKRVKGDRWQIPFGRVYQVDDPYVSEVPKNKEALAAIGKSGAAGAASGATGGNGNGSANKAPAKPAPQPVPADDDISDL